MARSTVVTIYNMTGFTFTKDTASVVGHWEGEPTDINPYINSGIKGNNKMIAKSVDTHALDGTGGTISYKLNGIKDALYIHWDNPYWGGNTYSISASESLKKQYNIQLNHNKGGGNEASIDIVLYQRYMSELCLNYVIDTQHSFVTDVTLEGKNIFFKISEPLSADTSLMIQAYVEYDKDKRVQVLDNEVPTVPGESNWVGTPNLGPNVTYELRMTGTSSEKNCKIRTIYKELTISPTTIGPYNQNISETFTASGCNGKMIFNAHGLPDGITIFSDGHLSGAVSGHIEKEIQVEVRNEKGNHGVQKYQLKVN